MKSRLNMNSTGIMQQDEDGKLSETSFEDFYMNYGVHIPTAKMELWGEVTAEECQRLCQGIYLIGLFHEHNPDIALEFDIHSDGGSWYDGMSLYSELCQYKGQIITKAGGSAMSMGAILLQTGDIRKASPVSTIMIHDGSDDLGGTIQEVKNWSNHTSALAKQMHQIFANKTGRTAKYWANKCKTDYIMTADKALKEGLIDEIIDLTRQEYP